MHNILRKLSCAIALTVVLQPCLSQETDIAIEEAPDRFAARRSGRSLNEIAVDLVNPAGSVGAAVNEFRHEDFQGDISNADEMDRQSYLFTTSMPFPLRNGKNIVVRATFPVTFGEPTYPAFGVDVADWRLRQFADQALAWTPDGEFRKDHSFLDDINFDVAYGGTNENGFISMFGLAGVLAASQDGSSERDQYLLGPQFALGRMTDWGVLGVWANHLTDVATADEKFPPSGTNMTTVKLFFAYGLGNGWHVISNPAIVYDWEALSGNELFLPIGGGVSKTLAVGRMPMKLAVELYHYIESPDSFGPEWMLSFTVTPVISDRYRR